jgi:hypothetical protein
LLEEVAIRSQPVQDLIKDQQIYTVLLNVKWFNYSTAPVASTLLQDHLLTAAKELESLTPSIENYDFISRDVQHFTDLLGRKYTLLIAIRLYDYRSSKIE